MRDNGGAALWNKISAIVASITLALVVLGGVAWLGGIITDHYHQRQHIQNLLASDTVRSTEIRDLKTTLEELQRLYRDLIEGFKKEMRRELRLVQDYHSSHSSTGGSKHGTDEQGASSHSTSLRTGEGDTPD